MATGVGYPFKCVTAFVYNSGAALSKGHAVMWGQTTARSVSVEYPEPEVGGGGYDTLANQGARTWATTRYMPAVTIGVTSSVNRGIVGVALESIPATSWGHIALSGIVDVMITSSLVTTLNRALVYSTLGMFTTVAAADEATVTLVHGWALEAATTASPCASALVSAFLPPGLGYRDYALNYGTA